LVRNRLLFSDENDHETKRTEEPLGFFKYVHNVSKRGKSLLNFASSAYVAIDSVLSLLG